MAIRAEEAGSVSRLKGMIKKGSVSGGITRFKPDSEMNVRFLDEPDKWVRYTEHYDKTLGYFVCVDDGSCIGCLEGVRGTSKFIVNAVDMDSKEVIALVLPYSVADEFAKRLDKKSFGGTLTNRTWIISRTGSGINDTSYSLDYEEPKKRDMSGYDRLDLMELLEATIPTDDDDDDDDDRPRRSEAKRGRAPSRDDDRPKSKRSNASTKRRDDYDEDDDDEDTPPRRAPRKVAKAKRPEPPRKVAKRALAGKVLKKRRSDDDDDRPGY